MLLMLLVNTLSAQQQKWTIAGDRITSPWADQVDPLKPLPEYPRPQLTREKWVNLMASGRTGSFPNLKRRRSLPCLMARSWFRSALNPRCQELVKPWVKTVYYGISGSLRIHP